MSASDLAEFASPSVVGILGKLGTDPKTGLNSVELQERLSKYGPNALPEDKKSVLSGLLAYFWGPIPWGWRQGGRNGCSDYCTRSEHLFWPNCKTGGRRRKRFALPTGGDEDRQLPDYPGAGFGGDPGSQPPFRYARPLRSRGFVKARRNRSYPFGGISASGHACRTLGNDGSGRPDASQKQSNRFSTRVNRGIGGC